MGLQGLGGGIGANQNNTQQQQQQPSQGGAAGLGGIGGGIGMGAQPSQPQAQQPVQNAQRPQSGLVSLKKGAKVSLAKSAQDAGIMGALSKIKVGLGWDINKYDAANFDLDVFTFALKSDEKVRDERDFIFFNNPANENRSIALSGDNRTGAGAGDDESVEVELNTLPQEIQKIVFAITINEGEQRKQNFGMVDNAFVRIMDANSGKEFLRYDLSEEYSLETAIVVGELYKHNGEWKFRAVGSGFNNGLVALCSTYGISAGY